MSAIAFCWTINAQITTPRPSPVSKVEQMVGLTTVKLEYSRPGVKGRTVFAGNGLVPYGKIWRTGANSATKISFSDDVTIEGKALPKGDYAILTMPGKSMWKVHFYKHESSNWSSYAEKTPELAVEVKATKVKTNFESFFINIDNLKSESATIDMYWANVKVSTKLGVEADKKVMANIEKVMAGPSTSDYYNAGSYLFDSGKDRKKALEYVQKATKVENPKFWQLRKEALILAKLKRYKEATAVAKKSLTLAKAAKNADYVKMNQESILEWARK